MGFLDRLNNYLSANENAKTQLMEQYENYSTYELLSRLGRILEKQYRSLQSKGSISAISQSIQAPAEKRMEYAAILTLLENRGISNEEAKLKAIDMI